MRKSKEDFVIQGVTNDKYELPVIQFDSYIEMSQKLKRVVEHCYCMVSKQTICREYNCKFIKILLDQEEEMDLYTNVLPKNCKECSLCRSGKLKIKKSGRYVEANQCVLGGLKYQTIDDEVDTCPLKVLKDHDKKLLLQVCEVIRDMLPTFTYKYENRMYFMEQEFESMLDQIENNFLENGGA